MGNGFRRKKKARRRIAPSSASSLPEVVGDAGLLVAPRDPAALAEAMLRVTLDRDLHARLRARGLARAREFSWDRTARRVREVLGRAASGR